MSSGRFAPSAGAPVLTGRTERGVGYRVNSSGGNAAAAGIRAGDVILTIAGSPVPDNSQIMGCIGRNRYDEAYFTFRFCLEDRRTGERLPVRLEREGRQMEVALELEAHHHHRAFWPRTGIAMARQMDDA